MKPSPERQLIVDKYPDTLDLSPGDGLHHVGLLIQRLKLEHAQEVAALRKLEHSYRTACRWARVKDGKPAPTDINEMSQRDFDRLMGDISNG